MAYTFTATLANTLADAISPIKLCCRHEGVELFTHIITINPSDWNELIETARSYAECELQWRVGDSASTIRICGVMVQFTTRGAVGSTSVTVPARSCIPAFREAQRLTSETK